MEAEMNISVIECTPELYSEFRNEFLELAPVKLTKIIVPDPVDKEVEREENFWQRVESRLLELQGDGDMIEMET
jgi:hypothetical protein